MEAANDREAFEFTGGARPALLLMSLRMPVLDGFEVTRRIRGRDSVFPIVAMSTYPPRASAAKPSTQAATSSAPRRLTLAA